MSEQQQEQQQQSEQQQPTGTPSGTPSAGSGSGDLTPQQLYDAINGLPDKVVDAIRQVAGSMQSGQQGTPNPGTNQTGGQSEQPKPDTPSTKWAKFWLGEK